MKNTHNLIKPHEPQAARTTEEIVARNVTAERDGLLTNMLSLQAFIGTEQYYKLSQRHQWLLKDQHCAMQRLHDILSERIGLLNGWIQDESTEPNVKTCGAKSAC